MQAVCRNFPGIRPRFDPRGLTGDQFRCAGCLKILHDGGRSSAGVKAGRGGVGQEIGRPRGGGSLARRGGLLTK
jgi:hypothetical protein